MPAIPNNALLLKTDGTIETHSVTSMDDIRPLINDTFPEMAFFGAHPVSGELNRFNSPIRKHYDTIVSFLARTVARGQSLPPQKPFEYDFHRITTIEQVQLYVHQYGALNGSPRNPFFRELYGEIVMLGQCIDELSWNPNQ